MRRVLEACTAKKTKLKNLSHSVLKTPQACRQRQGLTQRHSVAGKRYSESEVEAHATGGGPKPRAESEKKIRNGKAGLGGR